MLIPDKLNKKIKNTRQNRRKHWKLKKRFEDKIKSRYFNYIWKDSHKWNFRNFRGGVEDDSRVSIVNDVNNCTKSSRCDAPLPLFRATDISRNGRVICSMSKLFIVSFPIYGGYGSNKNRKFNFEPPWQWFVPCTNG